MLEIREELHKFAKPRSRHLRMPLVGDRLYISREIIIKILYEDLGKMKMCPKRLLLHVLTDSEIMEVLFRPGKSNPHLLDRTVTGEKNVGRFSATLEGNSKC